MYTHSPWSNMFGAWNSLYYLEPEKEASKNKKEQKGDRRQLILPPGYLFPAFRRFGKFLKRSVPAKVTFIVYPRKNISKYGFCFDLPKKFSVQEK